MHCRKYWQVSAVVMSCIALLIGGGCAAPRQYVDGVGYVVEKHKLQDAKAQSVRSWPCLRVDAETTDELERATRSDDLADAKASAQHFLAEAHAQSIASTNNEFDRMTDDAWQDLNERYFGDKAVPDAVQRQAMRRQFTQDCEARFAALSASVQAAQNVKDLRQALGPVRQNIQPSIKTAGRFGRAAPYFVFTLPSLMMVESIHSKEYRGVLDVPFDAAIRYSPAAEVSDGFSQTKDAELLQQCAPIIVQEWPKEPSYPRDVDRFGQVIANTRQDVRVNPDVPSVYCYSRDVTINGAIHKQLIYTHWYPEHPKLKAKFDPEQGNFEGITMRITLDRSAKPAFFETVYNCGCYHRLYPSQALEDAAKAQYGGPEEGKNFAIEHNVPSKFDLIVPKTIAAGESPRPILRCRSGWHGPIDVAFAQGEHAKEVIEDRTYRLHAYEDLEHLPLPDGGGYTSLFYENGLVRNAQRWEGVYFTPIGILSAGQPRQRGTQLIQWDHWDFDDPQLFERTLRLPKDF